MTLRLTCLGEFQITLAGEPLTAIPTDKARALLVYLAVEGRVHARSDLVQLFWPGYTAESANNNLRQSLHRLRNLLADAEATPWLLTTRQTVQINLNTPISVDVTTFTGLLADCSTHDHPQLADCPTCLARLQQAVDLYQGDFLAGFTVADSDAFEEWRRVTQEQLHIQALDALTQLADATESNGDAEGALRTSQRQLTLEPWLEAAHRRVMRLLAQRGQRAAAIAQYQRCRQVLAEELGVEPDEETTALYEQLRTGPFPTLSPVIERLPAPPLRPLMPPTEETRVAAPPPQRPSLLGQADELTHSGIESAFQDKPNHPGTLSPHAHLAADTRAARLMSAPGPVPPTVPHNLPTTLPPIVGRTRSLPEIISQLQTARLLTLVGPGGMGKTRLALAVGQRILDFSLSMIPPKALASVNEVGTADEPTVNSQGPKFPDGVWFVSLVSINTPAALPGAIATALGITLQGDDPRRALLQNLRSKHLLLILDNFEHLLVEETAVDLVVDLLETGPGVQILVTSRERLKLHEEQSYTVPPLTFALAATLAEAETAAAVQLFVQSVQRSQPDFQLTATNLKTVLRICELVQGMPLGLVLAAANAGSAPLTAIADAIAQSTEFLTIEWRDLPARQRSMRAVFAWSWRLLSAAEQRVLRQSARFRGGFDYTAAQAVIDATPALLTALVNKSLLQWQAGAPGEGRYAMHELLRQFAAEALAESGERAVVEERHGRYYLAYLTARGFRLGRGEPKEASAEIGVELDNVRLAWHWAATQGGLAELDQALYAWWQFCLLQGLGGEAQQSLAAALAGVRTHLTRQADDAPLRLLGTRLLAKLLALHANCLFAQGRDAEMAAQAREAMQLGAASGGFEGEILGNYVLGRVLQDAGGQKREAQALWEQTIQLIQRYQSQQPENELLHELHWMTHIMLRGSALHFGDYAGCHAHIVEALHICQTLGKQRGELTCLSCLGEINFFLYDFAAAEADFRAELALGRSLGYRLSEMSAQEGLARSARLRGDYATARTLLEQSLSTATELAFHYDEALWLAALIRLHCQLGDQTAASACQDRLTQLLAQVPLGKECRLYGYLAAAFKAHYAGDQDEALAAAEQANQINQQGGDILFRLVDTALILGHVRAAAGQWAAAQSAFQEALTAFQQFNNRGLAAEPQAGLAQIALAQGDRVGALAQIEALLPVLAQEPHAGYNDPFFIYLTGYRVLVANGDPRAATLLQSGYDLLHQDAAALDDESRQRFLSVPLHRDLVAAYTEMLAQQDKVTSDKVTSDKVTSGVHGARSVTQSPSHLVTQSPSHLVTQSPPHNLPVALTPFVGRTRSMAEILSRLQQGVRLLTLVGPGGMGKTRLALAVGQQQLTAYPDGVWFVALAAVTNPAAITTAIAAALRLPITGDDARTALAQLLQPKRLLLILDNFEQLLVGSTAGAELVAALLQAAPGVKILVTSRERLQLRSEQIYQVPPLNVAPNATLAEATMASAARLFVQSAQFAQADFQLTPTNLTAVLRICALVEGIPLGLELAAAQVGTLSLEAIADAIARSAEFLAVDWVDLPARQRSMRAVFAWSWQLLNAIEQRALRQLSIFRGGFTGEAAQAITGVTLPTLTRLVHCSLLHWSEVGGGQAAEGRYALHELVRQFAAEELARVATEAEQVVVRYTTFYLDYLVAREMRLERTEPRTAATEIQREFDNIRQAWQGAVQRWEYAALQRSARALFAFYRHTGLSTEAFQTFQAIVDECARRTQPDLASGQQSPPDLTQSIFVAICANLLVPQSKLEQAIAMAQHALALAQAEGITDAAAFSHLGLGQAFRLQGRLTEAQHHLEQTLQLAHGAPVRNGKSELLYDVACVAEIWLGWLSVDAGFYQQAREPMQRSLHLAQSLGKRRMAMMALLNLANLARLEGANPAAQQGYEEALELAREVGYRWGEGVCQYELGYMLRLQGEYSRATTLFENALTIFQEIGEHHSQANALIALGQLYAHLGDFLAAEGWLTRYQHFIAQVKGGEAVIHHLQARTVLALHQGDLTQALAYATEGWQMGQAGNPLDGQAYALIGMGHAQRELDQLAEASTAYQQALELYKTIQRPDLVAEAQAGLAACAQQQGDLARALGLVETVLAQLTAQPISGQDEPFFLYLTCYQVLAAAQDPRAPTILQQGYQLLQRYADQIKEDRLRRSFLENVPVHRALQQAYAEARDKVTRWQGDKVAELPNHPLTQSPTHPVTPTVLYNLPTPLPPLIGRERDLAEIVSRLRQPGTRLLTLAGPGGMGKTRLALAAAAQVAPHFAAGVCLVELAELTEPALLPQTVAAALGQTELAETGGEDPVARYLGDKSLLLVLDNCEHMDEAVAHWSKRWLSACPSLRILATSHGALTVPGEVVWPIPTLAYPPSAEVEPDRLLTFAAVQLFVARAREVKADFALTAANGSAIAEICRRLDGIPLALELAAARVRSLTPTEIAARLNKGMATALANNRSAPARHQTMQAALDWSFAALDADEQLLFQQLAVFAGGFTLPAVESVTQLPDALDRLERLLERALIITETIGEQTRYRLLGVIRRYAYDKLNDSDAGPALRQRHTAYFLHLAESAQMDVQADGEALWLQPEAENLSSAVDWALTNGQAASAVRLAGALTWYWWIRGALRSQRPSLQQAIASLALAKQPPASVARHDETVAAALLALATGALLALWEEPDQARLAFTQALALAEATPNQHLIGLALRRLAAVAIGQKAYEAANAFIERGLVVWQALGSIWHVAWLYALQGDLAEQRGDHDGAWLAYEASSRLPVDPGARAYPFRRMAYLALARGERNQALALCRESLQLNRATGDRQGIAACLVGVARFTVAGAQTVPQAARLPLLRRAAELLGAVEALLQTVEGRLLQVDDVAYQQTTHALQEQLAPATYQAALATGRSLTVEQATALAMQEETLAPPVEPLHPQEPASLPSDPVTRWQGDKVPSRSEAGAHGARSVTQSPSHPVTGSPGHPVTGSPLLDWAEMPMVDFFVERTAEVAQLTAWLTPTTGGGVSAQLISILGMGGMGKTTLAATVAKAVAPHFAVVIWRSVLNAPPPSELLHNWLQTLSRQTLTTLPESLDEQLRLLLTYLQQERCLLVLDNVESIFTADTPAPEGTAQAQSRAGVTRPGYEGYDQLFQRLASSDHQSCLLLTSREQPYALLRAGRQAQVAGRIQVLPLTGLDQQAGYALLQSNGLHASTDEAAQLVENYSGNPLALQIVAATITDFFGGDVAAFQQEEGHLFDGMRLVLDQQFARLSPLEREILVWLAIEREPVTVPMLRNNFIQPVATAPMLEALQALQNRSLLEKRDAGFTLQNVVIEYTTDYLIEQVCREIADDKVTAPEGDSVTLSPSHPVTLSFLNRFALLKAQAKKFVRASQARLLLQPVADRLVAMVGRRDLVRRIPHLLDTLRAAGVQKGYAGGNLLNLLVQLGEELIGYDFSHLPVWQADLSGLTYVTANFTGADLGRSTFTAGIMVDRVAFQPTGELWVAGMQNGVLGLWQTVEGQLTDAFQHTGALRGPLAFSPDGQLLATDTAEGHIHIWSTSSGELRQRLAEHPGTLYTLAFSNDGAHLAGCGSEQVVRLWDLRTGRCVQRLDGYTQGADALAFSADGQFLATGGGDGLIQVWDRRSTAEAGRRVAAWQAHRQPLGALAFSPDGRWLASGSHAGEIQLWALTPGAAEQSQASTENGATLFPYRAGPRCQGHTSIIRVLRFVPTADPAVYLLASASADRTVRIWSLTGQLRYTLIGHTNALHSLSVSPDGQQLASTGDDKQIFLWDVATGQALHSQQAYRSALQCLAFSPDGQMLASGGADHMVRLWQHDDKRQPPAAATQATEPRMVQSAAAGSQIRHFLRGHTHFLCSVAFSPDGQTIASGDADRTIRLWDRATGQPLQTLREHQGSVRALAFAPNQSGFPQGPALLASAGADRIIRLWSVATQQRRELQGRRQLVGHEDEILALAFDQPGRHLVSGCADGSIRIWDLQRGVTLHQLTGHTAPVTALAIHPTANIIASSSFDRTIRFWDLRTGACLQVNRGAQIGAHAVAFSPDGQYLAYTASDYAIYLWPWPTAAVTPILPTTPLRGHTNRVDALTFSPTSATLASCSTGGAIRLWDVASQRCSQILRTSGPYAGMNITGVTGISAAQKAALKALGAVEDDKVTSDKVTSDKVTSDKVTELVEATPSPSHRVTGSPGHPVTQSPLLDWAEMPMVDFFVERRAEVTQLREWLTPTAVGGVPAQLISILGMGGMGKTTLAATVTKAVAPNFAVVIWRSLLNAPPLPELLRNWLQTLSRQTLTVLPDSLDEQLRLLLTYLQQERCLLVLDNVESIFVANTPAAEDTPPQSRAGVTRPDYEGYDQLFQRLASSDHQSCLLLTSREQPYALLRIATGRKGQTQPATRLQVLTLAGLDQTAGQALLANNGLHPSTAEAAKLIENYSGNPLALQIVAATIADFFGGDVAAFQAEDGQLFDGMRLVLDQQFARLSPLERQILVWLAIEREPVTVPLLRSNFVQPVATAPLLEALQALQNRSLLEKRDSGLTLQNVIIEYTTEYLVAQVCEEIADELRITNYDLREAAPDGEHVTRNSKLVTSFLNRFALLKAGAKEYVRQSQSRLIVEPVITRLRNRLGRADLGQQIRVLITRLKQRPDPGERGYAAGNLLNLLIVAGIELTGYDLSALTIWQAYLRACTLYEVNFAGADLTGSEFADTFATITRLIYSRDGRLLLGAASVGDIRVWLANTLQPVGMLQGHSRIVMGLAVGSTQSQLLASCGEDGTVRLWNLAKLDAPGLILYKTTGFVCTVAISPLADLVASAGDDPAIQVWDADTRRLIAILRGHTHVVTAVAFTPDGRYLASCSGDHTVRLWDVSAIYHPVPGTPHLIDNSQIIYEWSPTAEDVWQITISPDGQWLAGVQRDGTVWRWQLDGVLGNKPGQLLQKQGVHYSTLAFSVDSSFLAVASLAKTIWLLDSRSGEVVQQLEGHTQLTNVVTFSPDGKTLASSGSDRVLRVWELATGRSIQALAGAARAFRDAFFAADGQTLVTCGADRTIRIWEISQTPTATAGTIAITGHCRHTLQGHNSGIWTVAVDAASQVVASAGEDCNILLWDRHTGRLLHKLQGHRYTVTALAFSPDGQTLVSGSPDQTVRLWNYRTYQPLVELRDDSQSVSVHEQSIWSVALSPDGAMVAAGYSDGSIALWDIREPAHCRQFTKLRKHAGWVRKVAFSPDGTLLASGSNDQTVRIWEVATGELRCECKGHTDWVMSVAFHPDGQRLASAGYDNTIRLWEVATGKPIMPPTIVPATGITPVTDPTPMRHNKGVMAVTFHPQGHLLLSASQDERMTFWQVANQQKVQSLLAPGPYSGLNITGVTGLSEAQKGALRALGAVEE